MTVVKLTERARLEASGGDAEAAVRGSLTLDGSGRGTKAESESGIEALHVVDEVSRKMKLEGEVSSRCCSSERKKREWLMEKKREI